MLKSLKFETSQIIIPQNENSKCWNPQNLNYRFNKIREVDVKSGERIASMTQQSENFI